nr:hypothetical protein [Tanacetum cinerariifolium]
MILRDLSSWDLDKATWGGRVRLFGTIQVVVRCTRKLGEGMGGLARKWGNRTLALDKISFFVRFIADNMLLDLAFLVASILVQLLGSNTLSWKPYQGGSSKLNLPDHRIKRYLNAVEINVAHIDVITTLMKECRAPRNQDFKHKESTKRSVLVETPTSTTLVSCDGLSGYDCSDQAEEGPNYALMAYTSSSSDVKISTDFTCSQTCLETVKTLKSQNEQLLKDLKKSELMVLGYKTGL